MSIREYIPVIDLFAGPGGLGEGFSSLKENGEKVFDIKLSIEKDSNAHKTLELRSFFRKFTKESVPDEYYNLLRKKSVKEREIALKTLFAKYPEQAKLAKEEAWHAELGNEKYPSALIDKRIRNALNGSKNWCLIGGPPCQAYSIAGRSRVGGVKENDHRVYLYKEYLRIIAVHHPAVFVMENVKGLLSAKLNDESIFHRIMNDLKYPSTVFPEINPLGYRVYSFVNGNASKDTDYLIKSEGYGIPQKRHRVILLGIREDLDVIPDIITRREKVTLSSVIEFLPKVRSAINREYVSSKMINGKKKRIYSTIKDSEHIWEEIINKYIDEIHSWNGFIGENRIKRIKSPKANIGSEFVRANQTIRVDHPLTWWYIDDNIEGVINHETRSHLKQDLLRYLYLSIYSNKYNTFPKLTEYEKHNEKLLPEHTNAKSDKFSDRFRVQLSNEPASTITSHISKDGHYYIHYDYSQCRSLTVREAARIQTFPDNYLFCGSRTSQFHQVGNAVPPYLAFQLASIVKKILF